jgi:gluconate 2-dehydrogenase alpha chain
MAKELGSRTPLSILVLERGPGHNPDNYPKEMDEVDGAVRMRSGYKVQDCSTETATLRRSESETALPLRELGLLIPGTGVGGAGEHWGATTYRMMPECFEVFTKTVEKYGVKRLPEGHSLQDWGVTYDEMEPYYTRAENLIGASGKAGNIRGKLIEGGNIFEGWRSGEYPTPPTTTPYFSSLFREAVKSLGYHPFPAPTGTLSEAYTNPDGVSRPGCTYCGFCNMYGCMIGAKAQPTSLLLPVIKRHNNISIRTGTWIRRLSQDSSAKGKGRVTGVTYVDASGQEFFQPAELVILATWTLNNTRLLLLSKIGEPYDVKTGHGNIGRNLSVDFKFAAARVFMEQPLNRFMGSAPTGVTIGDFDGGVIDNTKVPFLRGGVLRALNSGYQPVGTFGPVPRSVKGNWGAEWKKAAVYWYDRLEDIRFDGEVFAYRTNFMDLDPTYKDVHGDPLIRMTMDWGDNERRMAEFATEKGIEVARVMGAKDVIPFRGLGHFDANPYVVTQLRGGTIMGKSPESSVLNPYLQHWKAPNLFVLGSSVIPYAPTARPTLTLLTLTIRTADAIVDRYLKNPGPLA